MQKIGNSAGNHRRIILIVVILVFCLCGILAVESMKGYHDDLQRAGQDTQNLANAISQNALGTFSRVDLLLARAQEVLLLKEAHRKLSPLEMSEILRKQKNDVPEVEVIGVTDADGNYIGNTTWQNDGKTPFVVPKINASDRAYFKQHRDNPALIRFITEPVVSRSTGNMVIALVRKRPSPTGKFNGVIFATLNLNYFSVLFEKMNAGPNEVAALWNSDRILLARHPKAEEIGKHFAPSPELKMLLDAGAPSGTYTASSGLDGVRRVISFQIVEGLPLLVTVGRGEEDVLASWRRHLIAIVGLCTFIVGLTIVSLLYHFQDLRELDRQRAIAFQATKMSALGEMASGIAHEINNPLAIISGRASQILMMISSGNIDVKDIQHKADRIIQTSMRVARIIRGLRSFARNSGKDPMLETKLSTIIENTLELSQERFKAAGIELRIQVNQDCAVACRESQISQVLINLLNNSYDAVVKLENPWVEVCVQDRGREVVVSVTDSGDGIPYEIVEKLMQPFFTTKDVDKGTGLGLSISKGIVEEHGGHLELDMSSKNTRFVFTLPKSQTPKS